MNYEIVHVEEKRVAGIQIRTSNNDPHMSQKIGELWQRFYQDGIYHSIPDKRNDKSIGLYTHYEMDVHGEYDVIVCCEVQEAGDSDAKQSLEETEIQIETIPAGKYAKFIVQGHMQQAVAEFWMKLWSMKLDRKFSSDFEEYQSGGDMDNAEIHIYIALN